MPLFRWIKEHLSQTILLAVVTILCIQNFTPDTFLIGWDNLMPELNIWLNLRRSLLAAWQEYQGLGLVGGMGHASELVRQLLILPLALTLPTNLIRYLWHFAMLVTGSLGVYYWTQSQLKTAKIISLCGSLFYLLNFGTIQLFWVPFEPFSTFWGFLPWLILVFQKYLYSPTKKNLLTLLLINLLATPSFYVQTIFVVYTLCLIILSLAFLLTQPAPNLKPKTLFTSALTIILINSFWLLPFVYFLKNNSQNPRQALGNVMATQETFERNQRRGTVTDFAILRGYYYDFPSGNAGLMSPWISYQSNLYVLIAYYLLSFVVLVGLVKVITTKPKKGSFNHYFILGVFLLCAIALLADTPIFSQINTYLRQNNFVDQVFRSPWTKFIVPSSFVFSILATIGLQEIVRIFSLLKYSPLFSTITTTSLFLGCLLVSSFPSFTGNYISPQMRQPIPSEYFELFDFFKNKPANERIMNLPQGSFWGWTNYSWKAAGSGFIWYAIPQPILDRAFDVWELKNENYYFELTSAIQKNSPKLVKEILDKYSVKYVIFDNHVIFPDEKIYSKLSTPSLELLNSIPDLKLVKDINSIKIYHYEPSTSVYGSPVVATSKNPRYIMGKPITPVLTDINFDSPITPSSHSPLVYPQSQYIGSEPPRFLISTKLNYQLLGFHFDKVTFNHDYFLKVETRNLSGHPLTVAAFDDANHYKFFYSKLPSGDSISESWFYIPQMEQEDFNQGMTLLFNNPSYNSQLSTNEIINIRLYPSTQPMISPTLPLTIHHPISSKSNIFYYRQKISSEDKFLNLSQSFSPGWIAFYFKGVKPILLTNHHLANGWSNSWEIPSELTASDHNPTTVYIFFWPQLLQFTGMILVVITFIRVIRSKK